MTHHSIMVSIDGNTSGGVRVMRRFADHSVECADGVPL
jgi:hypothetical protein